MVLVWSIGGPWEGQGKEGKGPCNLQPDKTETDQSHYTNTYPKTPDTRPGFCGWPRRPPPRPKGTPRSGTRRPTVGTSSAYCGRGGSRFGGGLERGTRFQTTQHRTYYIVYARMKSFKRTRTMAMNLRLGMASDPTTRTGGLCRLQWCGVRRLDGTTYEHRSLSANK